MPEMPVINSAEAVRQALDEALGRWPEAFIVGEGAADPTAIFGTVKGLPEKYGRHRVLEMPIAENGLTGIVIGAAMVGQRPIMVHQRVDFALLSLEQLFNNAAKTHYASSGAHKVPIVIRMIIGRGWGQGPAHSQSLETMFAMVPGLKVVMPTTPSDFKGLLLGAIQDDNPVIFLEHRWCHYVTGEVEENMEPIPLDGPVLIHQGDAATIVATSYMTLEARRAVDLLQAHGVHCDLFDLRVLRPLKLDGIVDSVHRTGRLLTLDTGNRQFGMGAEIAASVVEQAFGALKAAPVRLGLPDHPTPSSKSLAADFYPTAIEVTNALQGLIGFSDEIAQSVRDSITAAKADLSSDQPDPAFKGPF